MMQKTTTPTKRTIITSPLPGETASPPVSENEGIPFRCLDEGGGNFLAIMVTGDCRPFHLHKLAIWQAASAPRLVTYRISTSTRPVSQGPGGLITCWNRHYVNSGITHDGRVFQEIPFVLDSTDGVYFDNNISVKLQFAQDDSSAESPESPTDFALLLDWTALDESQCHVQKTYSCFSSMKYPSTEADIFRVALREPSESAVITLTPTFNRKHPVIDALLVVTETGFPIYHVDRLDGEKDDPIAVFAPASSSFIETPASIVKNDADHPTVCHYVAFGGDASVFEPDTRLRIHFKGLGEQAPPKNVGFQTWLFGVSEIIQTPPNQSNHDQSDLIHYSVSSLVGQGASSHR